MPTIRSSRSASCRPVALPLFDLLEHDVITSVFEHILGVNDCGALCPKSISHLITFWSLAKLCRKFEHAVRAMQQHRPELSRGVSSPVYFKQTRLSMETETYALKYRFFPQKVVMTVRLLRWIRKDVVAYRPAPFREANETIPASPALLKCIRLNSNKRLEVRLPIPGIYGTVEPANPHWMDHRQPCRFGVAAKNGNSRRDDGFDDIILRTDEETRADLAFMQMPAAHEAVAGVERRR